jgi:hypothetical protein
LGLHPLGTIRPLEQILALLIDAGVTPADALHVYRTYNGFLYGHIRNELQEPDENEAILRLGLHRLPAKTSHTCAPWDPSSLSMTATLSWTRD